MYRFPLLEPTSPTTRATTRDTRGRTNSIWWEKRYSERLPARKVMHGREMKLVKKLPNRILLSINTTYEALGDLVGGNMAH